MRYGGSESGDSIIEERSLLLSIGPVVVLIQDDELIIVDVC